MTRAKDEPTARRCYRIEQFGAAVSGSPNVFELLRASLLKLRRAEDVPEDNSAYDALKVSVVRTAAELSVLKDPHVPIPPDKTPLDSENSPTRGRV